MVSLWGTKDKKDGGDNHDDHEQSNSQHGEGSSHAPHERHSHDADERTRLLPPPSSSGYLDPDDPAVSASLHRLLELFTDTCSQ